jgi:TolB-like protein/Tfp pilus assembly protein PilF
MRKLAAIMFTDIVGYSALMSRNETQALHILTMNRELHKSAISQFNGEFIKEMGDGTLSIFQSSWEAVNCAIFIQDKLDQEGTYKLRIGIHIGDVVISENDVFGDGVNIASRIQALCESGGFCVSERVYEDIRNKSGVKADCLGKKSLKNIDVPVKVYSITSDCCKRILNQQKKSKEKQSLKTLQRITGAKIGRKASVVIAVIVLLAVILSMGYFLFHDKPWLNRLLTGSVEPVNKEGEAGWMNSIAVLPFVDLSPGKDQEYFCDGMSEELINVMTNIPGLKVVARTSAFSFKGKGMDAREIGRKLKVNNILEGSVRKSGNQLRISAQLIEVKNGFHLWSRNYDRELKDIFAIQDEIASAIVAMLKTKLLPAEKELIEKQPTASTEAYQLYLKGRFYWNKRTVPDIYKAIGYFDQAIGKDINFALAYAGRSSATAIIPEYSYRSPGEYIAKAIADARKALELDPTLAEPHAILGVIMYQYEYDWEGAGREFERALELNPNYSTAHHWYCNYLKSLGMFDQALAEMQRALELDPLSLIANTNLGGVLYFMRNYDQAREQLKKTVELDPDFPGAYFYLGAIDMAEGKYSESIACYQKANWLQTGDSTVLFITGYVDAKTGKRKEALAAIDQLSATYGNGHMIPLAIAIIYWGLGDREKTFEWLRKAYEERDWGMSDLNIDPVWDGLRSDPRFKALLKKVGLEK